MHREFTLSEIHGEVCYMDSKWKMMLNKECVPYILIDLENDPLEEINIIQQPGIENIKCTIMGKIMCRLLETQVIK